MKDTKKEQTESLYDTSVVQDTATALTGFGTVSYTHLVRVVIFAATKPRCCEAEAELNTLDGRNGESKLADFVFQSAEHRLAEPGGNACDLAADEASDGVFFRTRSCNRGLHVFGRFVACHGEVLPVDRREKFGRVLDSGNRVNARHDLDAVRLQQLLADAARNAPVSYTHLATAR